MPPISRRAASSRAALLPALLLGLERRLLVLVDLLGVLEAFLLVFPVGLPVHLEHLVHLFLQFPQYEHVRRSGLAFLPPPPP